VKLFRLSKINAVGHRSVGGPRAHGLGGFFQVGIHDIGIGIGRYPQHLRSRVIVWCQFSFPVGSQAGPGRILKKTGTRFQQHSCINKTATADADAAENAHILENTLKKIATHPQGRHPQQVAQALIALFKIFGADPASLFHDRHPVPLFRQPQRRDTAAKTASDDNIIKIHATPSV